MLKLLIADDEPKIRRDLKEIADWSKIGIEVVGEAEDGEIALQIARKTRPDILMVDICMPFLNGLDFIRQVRQFLPDSKIVIITVYDDFAYAQQAVKLQIFDYILKPIDREQLLDVIGKAKLALESSRLAQEQLLQADSQLKKNFEPLKKKFLLDLIHGRLTKSEKEEQSLFFHLPAGEHYYLMSVRLLENIRLDNLQEGKWDRRLLLYAVQNIVGDLVLPLRPNGIFPDEEENIIVISSSGRPEQWQEVREEIEQAVGKHLKYVVITASGMAESGLDGVPDTYRSLLRSMEVSCGCAPIALLIQNYMEENFCDPNLSLQGAAEKIRISPSYLSKVLKKEIGLSFIDFLTQLRIRKATQLMKDPSEKIHEIAEKVGYGDQHYFSTAFKKTLGISPTEYRRRWENT